MNRLRMAVVGVGHLGQSHARILASLPDVELVGVVDVNSAQAQLVAERCHTRAVPSHRDLLDHVDAVSVVVPTIHHWAIARDFVARRIPVLVEKPMTATLDEAEQFVQLVQKTGTIVQVGHIERFNPAFEELIRRPIQPKFVECERHGPFTGRSTDIGAVLDLMIHDLDLLLTLVGAPVLNIQAVGASVFGGHEDIVNATLQFQNGCVAHVTASRLSPHPKRRLRVWAPEGYAGIDFVQRRLTLVQPSRQLLEQGGLKAALLDPARRAALKSEIFGRHLEVRDMVCTATDQLTRELQHFVDCVQTGRRPRVTVEDGRQALALASRILDYANAHSWTGTPDGPCGPRHMPRPLGRLFETSERRAA